MQDPQLLLITELLSLQLQLTTLFFQESQVPSQSHCFSSESRKMMMMTMMTMMMMMTVLECS